MMDIRSTPSSVRIHQYQAEMQIVSKLPKIEVHNELPRIQIDQRQCFDESGLKGVESLRDEMAGRAKAAVLQGIERVAVEGDMLGDIKNKKNPIPEIAYSKLFDKVDYNIELMPRSKPKIDFIGGNLDIKVHEGYVDIQVTPGKPQIDVRLGSIEFNYIPDTADTGSNMDMKV